MLQRRYPFVAAGRTAAIIFGVAALPLGYFLAIRGSDVPTAAVSAVFWGAVGAMVAFLVFSAEGPRRPRSRTQGAIADGVVAGIITCVSAAVFSTLINNQSSGGASLSTLLLAAGLGLVGGAIVGAFLGWLALRIGGDEPFERSPAKGRRARKERDRRKVARRR